MDHELGGSARSRRLSKRAYQVRQVSINRCDDLEGWRISRLLRDAATTAEADEAERQLGIWERAL